MSEGVEVIAGTGVFVEVGTGEAVGTGVSVGRKVEVVVGNGVNVNAGGIEVKEGVEVGNINVIVTPGVLVGTLGTHNRCPVKIVMDAPMQFADCNCSTVVRYKSEMR